MFEKILIPLDGSRFSTKALPYAIEIARKFNSEVTLLQVVQPGRVMIPVEGPQTIPSPAMVELSIESEKRLNRKNISRAERYLRQKTKDLNKQGISATTRTLLGQPAETIIEYCRKEKIKLVVMTTSGKSGIKRAILGSVADRVIREPGIPVLVIHPEKR